MLPLRTSLTFNAPFNIVLRHCCFKYGNEDKVLDCLLYVFPEALTVLDDKARLPLACTHKDMSENERMSKTMRLLSNFQEEMMRKEIADADATGGDS